MVDTKIIDRIASMVLASDYKGHIGPTPGLVNQHAPDSWTRALHNHKQSQPMAYLQLIHQTFTQTLHLLELAGHRGTGGALQSNDRVTPVDNPEKHAKPRRSGGSLTIAMSTLTALTHLH